jgi:hypothetical protein
MSPLGQTRSFGDVRLMSALHLITTVTRTLRHFAFGPGAEMLWAHPADCKIRHRPPMEGMLSFALIQCA